MPSSRPRCGRHAARLPRCGARSHNKNRKATDGTRSCKCCVEAVTKLPLPESDRQTEPPQCAVGFSAAETKTVEAFEVRSTEVLSPGDEDWGPGQEKSSEALAAVDLQSTDEESAAACLHLQEESARHFGKDRLKIKQHS